MRQTELRLSNKDRRVIAQIRSKGLHHAREVNRAHILAALDGKVAEAQIMQVLGVGRTVIWRTRAAYLQGGVQHACSTCSAQASRANTTPLSKHRSQRWRVRRLPRAPSAGRCCC